MFNKLSRFTAARACVMLAVLTAATAAQGQSISAMRSVPMVWREVPIVNPGFEEVSRILEPGEQSNGTRGASEAVATYSFRSNTAVSWANTVTVAGWRTYRANTPTTKIYCGALRPWMVNATTPYLTGYSGNHVGMARITPMQQTLNVRIEPSTVYRLTFKAGYGFNAFTSGVYVALIAAPDLTTLVFRGNAGVPTLAATSGPQLAPPPSGTMAEYTVQYVSPAVLPPDVEGRYLTIHFIGSDGFPAMCFDDFRLRAARLPRAATPSGISTAP